MCQAAACGCCEVEGCHHTGGGYMSYEEEDTCARLLHVGAAR
jgi:hypothetical protein